MAAKRFLDVGSPLKTTVQLLRNNSLVRFADATKVPDTGILAGSFARIHSKPNEDTYTVWVLEESSYSTVIVDVPLHLMGQYFEQHQHKIFPHFG
jgi:hypothetical protein